MVSHTHAEIRLYKTVHTTRCGAEQGSTRSSRVVLGHVICIVDGHSPDGRDGLGSCLLAVSGHLLSKINSN